MKSIAVIGCGFSGLMTTVHLIRFLSQPTVIHLIEKEKTFGKGVAYTPYSKEFLLNVPAGKMSAFPDEPDHFLQWLIKQEMFTDLDPAVLAGKFVPRYLYGHYLEQIKAEYLDEIKNSEIILNFCNTYANILKPAGTEWEILLENGRTICAEQVVLTTGNNLPEMPEISDPCLLESNFWVADPWSMEAIAPVDHGQPVLILGNGLTMADTVIALIENGFRNKIYSLSRNGVQLIPHLDNHFEIENIFTETSLSGTNLLELLSVFNQKRRKLKKSGQSVEPLMEQLRPFTDKLWKNLSFNDKQLFLKRLRRFWEPARHRIPQNIYSFLESLRKSGQWIPLSGRLMDIKENMPGVRVDYLDKKTGLECHLFSGKIINCTGPAPVSCKHNSLIIKSILQNGIAKTDEFGLGLQTDSTGYRLVNINGKVHENLFTMGSHLKGMRWETTAVRELRTQAVELARLASEAV